MVKYDAPADHWEQCMLTIEHTLKTELPVTEVWKDIPDYERYYQASDWGRIKNIKKSKMTGIKKNKILKFYKTKDGRISVSLSKNNIRKTIMVHQLILRTFVGPCPKGMVTCHHPDPNQSNNKLSNLRWDTRKANEADKIKQGRKHGPRGSDNSKLTKEQVQKIRQDKRIQRKIAKDYDICQQTVSDIKQKKIWKHIE